MSGESAFRVKRSLTPLGPRQVILLAQTAQFAAPSAARRSLLTRAASHADFQCGPVDARNLPIWVNHADVNHGSCPHPCCLVDLKRAAGPSLAVRLGPSPRPEHVGHNQCVFSAFSDQLISPVRNWLLGTPFAVPRPSLSGSAASRQQSVARPLDSLRSVCNAWSKREHVRPPARPLVADARQYFARTPASSRE